MSAYDSKLEKRVRITTPFIAGILIMLMKNTPPLSFPLKKKENSNHLSQLVGEHSVAQLPKLINTALTWLSAHITSPTSK